MRASSINQDTSSRQYTEYYVVLRTQDHTGGLLPDQILHVPAAANAE